VADKINSNPRSAEAVLQVVSKNAIRYLEAMVGAYIQTNDQLSAARIKRIIHELKTVKKQAGMSKDAQ